jgi:hypothetical protein
MPDSGEQGLLGFRPVEIARYIKGPELETVTQYFLYLFSQMVHEADVDAADLPDFAGIEQCVFTFDLQVITPTPTEKGRLYMGGKTPFMIRTVHPFDWNSMVRKWFPKAVEKRLAGKSYLRQKFDAPTAKDEVPYVGVMGFFIPDDRTLVVADEQDVFDLLDRLAEKKPAPTSLPGWSGVDRDFAAIVLDLRTERPVTGRFPRDYPWGKDLYKLADSSQTLALGLSLGDKTQLRLIGTCKDDASARNAARSLKRLLKAADKVLANEEDETMKKFAGELLKNTVIESDGSQFSASTSASRNILQMMAALLHGED